MLALAGGAAMLGRGKKKFGTDAGFLTSGAAGGARLSTPPIGGTDHIPVAPTKVDAAPIKKPVNKRFQTRFTARGNDNVWRGPLEHKRYMDSTAGNRVPPSMRGGALHAEGYQRKIPGQRHYPGGWEGGYSMRAKGGRIGAKKGGRVTGIAKRGFGRALMKGKK